MYSAILLAALVATVAAQVDQRPTPVPILRQINSHNDDGSYTYGFEAGDGSYKIETKAATGEVRGKYGYVDSNGKVREVEYGANRNGFNPSGTDIQVPPPVIRASTTNDDYEDDGQYRPSANEGQYYPGQDEAAYQQQQPLFQRATPSRLSLSRSFNNQAPAQQAQYYQPQQQQSQYQQQQPAPRQQPAYQPIQLSQNVFNGHPARNIDLNSGSYSIQY